MSTYFCSEGSQRSSSCSRLCEKSNKSFPNAAACALVNWIVSKNDVLDNGFAAGVVTCTQTPLVSPPQNLVKSTSCACDFKSVLICPFLLLIKCNTSLPNCQPKCGVVFLQHLIDCVVDGITPKVDDEVKEYHLTH